MPEGENRRHTSTVTVALVDNAKTISFVDPADVRVETYRGSGAGGQHRNVTDSAVRLTHWPTGIVVKSEAQRSQGQNHQTAWAELERRVAVDLEASAAVDRNADRVAQVGNGNRVSHDWTWCAWRDSVQHHGSGRKWQMSSALRGRFL